MTNQTNILILTVALLLPAAAAAQPAPASTPKEIELKLRGLVHADHRGYLADAPAGARDAFLIRRARPILNARINNLADFQLVPDFGGGQTVLQDAFIDFKPFSWLGLRVGKFKPPIGLERLQSAGAIVFPERALPTALVPSRDVGFQLHGRLFSGRLVYSVGAFNGVVDGGIGDTDNDEHKEVAGRLLATPFRTGPVELSRLSLGLGFSAGNNEGTAATFQTTATGPRRLTASVTSLSAYRSTGQQTVFSYLVNDDVPDSTVIAQGRRVRISPQAMYHVGPFGFIGEVVLSRQRVQKGVDVARLSHWAWQMAASYVVGGKNAFDGVTPNAGFDPDKRTWGALELAGRIGALELDDKAFSLFSDPNRSVTRARAFGVAANWHLSANLKLSTAWEQTRFLGGAAGGGNRKTENVLFQRFQAAF